MDDSIYPKFDPERHVIYNGGFNGGKTRMMTEMLEVWCKARNEKGLTVACSYLMCEKLGPTSDSSLSLPTTRASLEDSGVWYLSFAGAEGFLGACYVEAEEMEEAVRRTWTLGINPGGEILILGPIPRGECPDDIVFDKLLTEAELGPSVDLQKALG